MRTLTLTAALLIFYFKGIAQTNIQLILSGSSKITKVYAQDFSFKEYYSTSFKDTIHFHFTKTNKIDLYNIGCFINDKQPWKQVWLDSGNITIHAHLDSNQFKIDTFINSPIYDRVNRFYKEYFNIRKLNDTTKCNAFLLDHIKENVNNPFSLWVANIYLNLDQNNKESVYDLKQVLDKQGDRFAWFRLYPDVAGRIENILSTEHLVVADLRLINQQGKTTSLTLQKTKYYVLDFWFLGCAPCRNEHKKILKTYSNLQQNNIEVIGISTDGYSKAWKDYISNNHYTWANYLEASNNKITEALNINAFPYYVIINSNGDILGRYNLFSDILKRFNIEE